MDTAGHDASSPWKMPLRAWTIVFKKTWAETTDDNVGLIAAGVAFYGFLAVVPLLGAVVLLYGLAAEPTSVIRDMTRLTLVVPADAARLIGEQLMEIVKASDGKKGLGILLSLALAIFGARNGAGAVITALNIAYEEREKRGFIRINLLALGITTAAVLVAIVAATAIAALAYLEDLLPSLPGPLLVFGKVAAYLAFTLAGAGVAATLYRFGPSRENARWVWLTPGSLMAAVMWLALTLGFGLYVANVGRFNATYGSLGAVVATLTWLYLSSYILIFGAELNSELERKAALGTMAPSTPTRIERPVAQAPAARPVAEAPSRTLTQPRHSDMAAFGASRAGARTALAAGLPKIGLLASAGTTLGLALIRREGRAREGALLLVACAALAYRSRRPRSEIDSEDMPVPA